MANTVGGLIVIGVDDGKQDHAHALAPAEPAPGRGEEWIRAVLANWIQPVVPNVDVRSLKSADEGKIYWLITLPPSTQAPHAVAAPPQRLQLPRARQARHHHAHPRRIRDRPALP
ncbi:helix-turn-helix domain-containing protein [Streptomyces sp. NPDC057705]|uniref:AlbA family DNA-binding domain-containing protein n=1 Tax=Streptomyces sp. NPDC057705 TaxID=3346222 RepID=UPI0036C1E6E1